MIGTATPSKVTISRRKVFLISSVGTALEYYDFFVYATATALVFNVIFFPQTTPFVGTLLSFGVFGVGFLARPLGGIIVGHLGDRFGRRPVLMYTVLLMGAATFLVGCLPTYSVVGVFAPIALVILRLVQGFAAGGEWGAAAVFGVEAAPSNRRAFYGAFVGMGMSIGALFSTGLFAILSASVPMDAILGWVWRIPFLIGGVLAVFALLLRRGLLLGESESPRSRMPRVRFTRVMREYPRQFSGALIASTAYSAITYVAFSYFLTFAAGLGHSTTLVLVANLVYVVTNIATVALFARWSDGKGRRVIMTGGAIGFIAYLYLFVYLVSRSEWQFLLLSFCILSLFIASLLGPLPAILAEQFRPEVRNTGVSTSYQVGAAIGGGFAPTLAVLVYAWSGNSIWSIATLGAVMLVLFIVGVRMMRETAFVPTEELGSLTRAAEVPVGPRPAPPRQSSDAPASRGER
jgi:MFS family permease